MKTESDKPAAIVAEYSAPCASDEADALARAIAVEQTLEMAPELVRDTALLERAVGRVEQVQHQQGRMHARIHYAADLADGQLGQLLNLAYGSVSLYPGVCLESLVLPPGLARSLLPTGLQPGGMAALRKASDVFDRALLGAVLKPRGSSAGELAQLAGQMALGGADLVKDDQNLQEASFSEFQRRVGDCFEAIEQQQSSRDGRCLYFPHLGGAWPEARQRAEWLASLGVPGVLLSPALLGLDHCQSLTAGLPLLRLHHPLLAGAMGTAGHGISPVVWYGLFCRLAGADSVIVPAPLGRISLPQKIHTAIVDSLLAPLDDLPPVLPASGGGQGLDTLASTLAGSIADQMVIVGGALQAPGDSAEGWTRRHIEALEEAAS